MSGLELMIMWTQHNWVFGTEDRHTCYTSCTRTFVADWDGPRNGGLHYLLLISSFTINYAADHIFFGLITSMYIFEAFFLDMMYTKIIYKFLSFSDIL
jgi:hypothetical protein